MRQTRPVADKGRPILLDLTGNGIEIAGIDRAPALVTGDDGLQHRTAWAGVGDGVLFFDAGMDGRISESREYVFTEWDPTAKDDMAALRARFDTNNDGVLNSADADFGQFKVMVTNPDGAQTAMTLAELGITQIALKTDATAIRFADGSMITGLSSFVKNGVVQTAGAVTLVSEAAGHRVETTVDGAVTSYVTKDAAGHVLGAQTSIVQTDWKRPHLTGRQKRQRSAHSRTIWKIAKSQKLGNFCSSYLNHCLYYAVGLGKWVDAVLTPIRRQGLCEANSWEYGRFPLIAGRSQF